MAICRIFRYKTLWSNDVLVFYFAVSSMPSTVKFLIYWISNGEQLNCVLLSVANCDIYSSRMTLDSKLNNVCRLHISDPCVMNNSMGRRTIACNVLQALTTNNDMSHSCKVRYFYHFGPSAFVVFHIFRVLVKMFKKNKNQTNVFFNLWNMTSLQI